MSDVPSAKELRDQAVRNGIDFLLHECTPRQIESLRGIHNAAPWGGLAHCPADKLDGTYELVRRTVIKNRQEKPNVA